MLRPISRLVYACGFAILLAAITAYWFDLVPMPDELANYQRFNPFSEKALGMLAMGFSIAWGVFAVPWSWLLACRLHARGRRPIWALLPLLLTGTAILGIWIGGHYLGGPIYGYQSENPGPYVNWLSGDFPILSNIVLLAQGSTGIAALIAVILSVEALRPDLPSVDDVFK